MSDTSMVSVDETLRKRFESAWLAGSPKPIEECLPPEGDERYVTTLEELVQIDLEFAWKRVRTASKAAETLQQPPRVEDYLDRFPVLRQRDVLLRLLRQEFWVRHRYGDRPSSHDYLERFPKSGVKPDLLEAYLREMGHAAEAASPDTAAADQIDRYLLQGEQGRGGFAVVWRADDPKMGRQVAVKQLRGQMASDESTRRRFVNEARVSARLEHPGVVPVHDLGPVGEESPFYTMKLVEGKTLAEAIEAFHAGDGGVHRERSLEELRLLNAFLAVVRTMEYAHAQGVIHRDLKPRNIILGKYGETVILDWGLAKTLQEEDAPMDTMVAEALSDSEETAHGTIQGTPAYMSPEQAAGNTDEVDPRSDIYSLGVILYQILTGRLPFEGTTSREVLRKVREDAPRPPRQFRVSVPRPLEAICLKCLAKSPAERYQEVAALRQDLDRYLADEPVCCYQESPAERLARWLRRHRSWALAGTAAAFLVAVVSVVASIGINSARERAVKLAIDKQRLAEEERIAREDAQHGAFNVQLARARELGERDPAAALKLLEDDRLCPPALRDFAWGYYCQLLKREEQALSHNGVLCAVYSPGEKNALASGGKDGVIRIWTPGRSQPQDQWPAGQGWVICLTFTPDGRWLASGGEDGTVVLWDMAASAARRTLRAHTGHVNALCFLKQGKQLLTAGDDGHLVLWDTTSGNAIHRFPTSEGKANAIALSQDGSRLASAHAGDESSDEGSVIIWSLPTRERKHLLTGHIGNVNCLAFLPRTGDDSLVLASAGEDRMVRLWDVERGRMVRQWQAHLDPLYALAVSPDGDTLVSTSLDKTIAFWDWKTGSAQWTATGHNGAVLSATFSADGARVASAGTDDTIRIWSLGSRQPVATLSMPRASPLAVAVSSGNRALAAAEGDSLSLEQGPGTVWLWTDQGGREPRMFQAHDSSVTSLAFSVDSKVLATGGVDRSIKIWDVGTGQLVKELAGRHKGHVLSVAFSRRGDSLGSAGGKGTVQLWDARSWRSTKRLIGHTGPVQCVAFSPDGTKLASASWDRTVKLWSVSRGKELLTLSGHTGAVLSLAFAPGGRMLASAGEDEVIRLWSVRDGRRLGTLAGHPGQVVQALVFSPDGKTMVSGGDDGQIKFWDPRTGQQRGLVPAGSAETVCLCLAFSPDGAVLVSGFDDHKLRLWAARPHWNLAMINR